MEAPRTVVIVSPWTSTSGFARRPSEPVPQASPVADERVMTVASQPGTSEFVRRSRPRAPRPSQRSGCGQLELLEERWDLLDLLRRASRSGSRGHARAAA